jgi:hypothetical protein
LEPDHREHHSTEVRTGNVVLDIGDGAGGLVFYTSVHLRWQEIEIAPVEMPERKTHTEVTERLVAGKILYTGVFPPLPVGDYRVCRPEVRANERFTIVSGQVTQIDWTVCLHP